MSAVATRRGRFIDPIAFDARLAEELDGLRASRGERAATSPKWRRIARQRSALAAGQAPEGYVGVRSFDGTLVGLFLDAGDDDPEAA